MRYLVAIVTSAIVGLVIVVAAGSIAKGLLMNADNPVVAFARDFSGGDAAIVETVERFVADPPTDLPTIGFYGAERHPAQTRVFLATVTLLGNSGKLDSVEDKYTYELLWNWSEAGVIDPATLPPAAKAVFGPIFDEAIEESDDEAGAAYRALAWDSYAKATQELEEHIAARGRVPLSVDATDGDTMYFALVAPDVAERWRDKALSEHQGYRAGVRSPMWDRFWDHLAYAARGVLVEEDREGYPPGTRLRDEAIPFAR